MRTLTILMLFWVALVGAHADEIRLLSTDYPPYFAAHLPRGGPLTEIVVEAYRRSGHEVSVEFVPWIRAMEYGKAGKVDGLHGAWFSTERQRWFVFSDPLPGNEVVVYRRRGEGPAAFTGFASLRPYSIGVVKGYRNPAELEAAGLRVDEADSDTTNLKKLARGRVDLILIERAVAGHLLANELAEYRDRVQAIEPPVEVLPLYVMISRATREPMRKVEDFNRGLARLRAEGLIDAILERHGIARPPGEAAAE